ncbi:MAG TPA: hypothetical protein ENI13_00740 [candidate division CPR3 bacterium]|uniref:Uncharacterized protein n=1 Tax=candidate division CPR3 bacterium TaxID=2268181 RepID=A0A7C1NPI8_UNCC3|nr:hypothetical protein [candidate division CPR3 bacterium]
MKRKKPLLDQPTPELVEKYVLQFQNSERYYVSDQAIIKLFSHFPENSHLEDILLKLSVINDLYSTNIYATFKMAKHIQRLKIDPELRKRSTAIVNKIAAFPITGKTINFYSFATKYCNWHDQNGYPIYDYFVERIIVAYRKRDQFAAFRKVDLMDYARYKNVLEQFRLFYDLQQFTFKRLDKFLWLYGKEKFPKKGSTKHSSGRGKPHR